MTSSQIKDIFTHLQISDAFLLGITGLAGSGKTTLSKSLQARIAETYMDYKVILIEAELYLKYPRENKMKKVRIMKSPEEYWDIFQIKSLSEDLRKIKKRISFDRASLYSRKNGDLSSHLSIKFSNSKYIFIVEGMQLVHESLLPYFDQVILVETNPQRCLKRKIMRANYRSSEETKFLFNNFEKPLFEAHRKSISAKGAIVIKG